jgi:hypothetical protein
MAKPKQGAIRATLHNELRAGAHPFFIEQVCRMIAIRLASEGMNAVAFFHSTVEEIVAEAMKNVSVPERTETGLMGPMSRILRDGKAIGDVDKGILHGVIVETYADMLEWHRRDSEAAAEHWCENAVKFFVSVFLIPSVDFAVVDSLRAMMWRLHETFGTHVTDQEDEALDLFIKAHVAATSTEGWSLEQLNVNLLWAWNDDEPNRFWSLLARVLRIVESQDIELAGTRFLRTLLAIKPGTDPHLYDAAQKVLLAQWHHSVDTQLDAKAAAFAMGHILTLLQDELEYLHAWRTYIRWLQLLPPKARVYSLSAICFISSQDGEVFDPPRLNEKSERHVEELVGQEGWRAICAYQNSAYWEHWDEDKQEAVQGVSKVFGTPTGMDKSLPEFQILEKALRSPRITQHDVSLAEVMEDLLAKEGVSTETVDQALEESLDILSGDLVVVVSHLRDEWMPVRRRGSELLGITLPRIDVARHKKFGDVGAACKFRIPVPDDPRKVIRGHLNPEGEMTLENTPLMDATTQSLLQAAVTQTLCAVLVPSLIEEQAPGFNPSGPSIRTGQPWSARPILRTVGEIAGTSSEDEPEVRGSRLNPIIAVMLFRWLLGRDTRHPFRLFVETEEQIGKKSEKYFVSRTGIKELLRRKQLSLSSVYIRAVRAHTQPVGAYMDQDQTIKIRKMSSKAERNYQRYRQEGGRELDYSSVQKTYLLPDGIRVPLEIPRTFNQGVFISLEEASGLVFDTELQEAIREAFAQYV